LTAKDLKSLDLITRIVPEPLGGAHRDLETMAVTLQGEIRQSLDRLCALPVDELIEKRHKIYLNMGVFAENG
jgi:acetyl-CoA carboxylase carboxyl transferase subunit alpha